MARSKSRLASLKARAAETASADDVVWQQKVAEVEIELLALEYTEMRTLAAVSTGKAPGPESSILKLIGTEVLQAIDELNMEVAAYYGAAFVPQQFAADYDEVMIGPNQTANSAPTYFNNRKTTIYGGSNEIQTNIICKAILGL